MPYRRALAVLTFAIALVALARPARAGTDEGTPIVPPGLEDVGVTEHLDGQIPLDAQFRDHTGKPVRLLDVLDGKRPSVLVFAYHTCPTVCSMVLSETIDTLKKIPWTVGKEYDVTVLSIDPHETLEKTAAKRAQLVAQYGREGSDRGFHFLVGDDTNIHRVTDAVGWKFHYVAVDKQFAHPTAIMLLKPNGEVARYLYGIQYSPNDVRVGLLEASNGKSITTIEKVILYCYHYDPNGGRYVLVATRVMQVGGALTALALGSFLAVMWLRERRRSRAAKNAESSSHPNHMTA